MHIFHLTPLVVLLSGTALAQPMTFDTALQRAAANSPALQASAAGVEASRSASISAGQLPDPTLDLGIQDFPVTGSNAGSFTRDNFTMTKIGVSQQFPNPAKRRAQRGRAQADIGVAEADQAVEAQNVRLQTALAWADLYYAKRRLAQLESLDESLGELQATVSARLTSGSARPSQALEPEQLRAAVKDRRSELQAAAAKAQARLARLTGDPAADVSGVPPALELDEPMLRAHVAALPRLQALDAQARVADADVSLARANKRPDWRIGTSYGRRDPAYGDLVSVTLSIDLPFFSKHRQDPLIAARESEASRARLMRNAGERDVLTALDSDLADHAMHHQRLLNARNTLVPLAKRRATLDMASYAAGKLDLGSALLATLAAAEAEVDALAREADVARDAIQINYTYGEALP